MKKHFLSLLIRSSPRRLVEHLAKREVDKAFLKMIQYLPSLQITRQQVSRGDASFIPLHQMTHEALAQLSEEIRRLIVYVSAEDQELITVQLEAFNALLVAGPDTHGDTQ